MIITRHRSKKKSRTELQSLSVGKLDIFFKQSQFTVLLRSYIVRVEGIWEKKSLNF